MARYGRMLFFSAFVAVVLGATWIQYDGQRSHADHTSAAGRATAQTLDAVVQVENAARDYTVIRDVAVLDAYTSGRQRLQQALRSTRAAVAGDPASRAGLHDESTRIDEWLTLVAHDVSATRTGTMGGTAATLAAARDPLLARIRVANDALARAIDQHSRDLRDAAGLRGVLVFVGLCALFAILNWLVFVRRDPGPKRRGEPAAETAFPVEYKRGKARRWDNDDVQLCAQALCLEEMLGRPVPAGAVYHAQSKARREVPFTPELRAETVGAIDRLHALLASDRVPPPVLKPQCRGCSLRGHCLPEAFAHPRRLAALARALFSAAPDKPDPIRESGAAQPKSRRRPAGPADHSTSDSKGP